MNFRAAAAFAVMLAVAVPQAAQARTLQCVPYAREVSGLDIRGNARTWWSQAEGRYERGTEPRVGAVLVLRGTRSMPQGHVAVVGEVIDDRHVYLNHANWSGPGRIERRALAEDVSAQGDWSEVRVWYAPIGKLGLRANPAHGFIYGGAPASPAEPSATFANAFADLAPDSPDTEVAMLSADAEPAVQLAARPL
jgi:hypothetical protein